MNRELGIRIQCNASFFWRFGVIAWDTLSYTGHRLSRRPAVGIVANPGCRSLRLLETTIMGDSDVREAAEVEH